MSPIGTKVCPFCGASVKEEFSICPQCGKELPAMSAAAIKSNEARTALYGVIVGFVCLAIAWFIFGIWMSLIAMSLGYNGIKKGDVVTKSLGGICLLVGIIFFFLSLASIFMY